jgi:hypothetical protein
MKNDDIKTSEKINSKPIIAGIVKQKKSIFLK